MKTADIVDAWVKIRKIDNTIADDVLDYMKNSAIEKLNQFSPVWLNVKMPKDGTKIIRWNIPWSVPQVVYYNEKLSTDKLCVWILGDCSNSYPEESFLPHFWQPMLKNPAK